MSGSRMAVTRGGMIPALLFLFLGIVSGSIHGQMPIVTETREGNAVSAPAAFSVSPVLLLPVAESAEFFSLGLGARLAAEFGLTDGFFKPYAGAAFQYSLAPIKADESITLLSLSAQGGAEIEPASRIRVRATTEAGAYLAAISDHSMDAQFGFTLAAGMGVSFLLSPSLDIRAGASYRLYSGLYGGIDMEIGANYYLKGRPERQTRLDSSRPVRPELLMGAKADRPGLGLDIDSFDTQDVFPVMKTWYDNHPLGSVKIINREQKTMEEVKLSFFVKQYMDSPKECPVPMRVEPGETLSINILSLFNDRILDVTEATKTNAELVLEYRMDGELYRDARNVTLRLLDRNATRWDDDRKVAAFVTAKDPTVLAFAKNVAGLVRGKGSQAVDPMILTAMGIYEALALEPYRLSYVVDPKTPFVDLHRSKTAVDYLQFPRQTLSYRAGDCDDLSILYCALLESVGVETAFITVPGHIYAAISLGLSPKAIPGSFTNTENLIVQDGRVWLPVEMTLRGEGFLRAWDEGARQWREATAKKAAVLIPVKAAWKEYEPVGLPGGTSEIPLPSASSVESAFLDQATRFVDRELLPKLRTQEAIVKKDGGTNVSRNKLGVLYAKLGKIPDAKALFLEILKKNEYSPALVNLGNIQYLGKEYKDALKTYQRAARVDPKNAVALLGIARVHYELGNYAQATTEHKKLAALNKDVAQQYAYLGGGTGATARAGYADNQREALLWNE